MPLVVAALAAIGSAIASAAAVIFGSVGGIGAFLGKLALNFAISALVGKLSSKKPKAGYTAEAQSRQFVVRSSIQARNALYGNAITSGPLVFAHTSGASKEYIHLVIALVGHETSAIDSVFFNDEEIPSSYLDGSGNVIAGRFSGYARIKRYLGTSTQTADADLISESGGIWTSDHMLRGVTYVYVRLKHSYDVYAGGLPNIKALIRGKELYDPRDGQTRWTNNVALCVRDYLISEYGLSAASGEIDDTICAAAANICDERVLVTQTGAAVTFDATANTGAIDKTELRFGTGDGVRFTTSGTLPSPLATSTTYYVTRISPTTCKFSTTAANARDLVFIDLTTAGSGSHNMVHYDQARYTASGVLSTEATPRENMQVLLTAMAGAVTWIQGKFEIHAGAYSAPDFALDEDDLRGNMSVQTRTPRKDLFNAVKGVYVEPRKYWQPTDFTPITNSTYETQDGSVRIYRDIELPFTDNQIAGQRIAKIHLEKSRQGITITYPAKLRAIETKAWATVSVSIAHLGWSSKVFRVLNWSLSPDGGVDLLLQEESSSSYDWAMGDATVVDAAPDTTLPSRVSVVAPTSLVLDSGSDQAFVNSDGTVIVRVFAQWVASADSFVQYYDFQWKKSTDSVYQSTTLSAATTTAFIEPAIEGVTYDVRIRAVNNYGAPSGFISDSVVATGKNTAPGDPSALATQSAPEAIALSWTNPVDNDLDHIEIWEATTNDRAGATHIVDVSANYFTRTGLSASDVRYYWLRAVDTTGNVSGYHPSGATAGVSGTAAAAGGSVAYTDITGTKPPVNADNTVDTVESGATVTSGGITFSAGGSIKGGATEFLTGIGWFLGYSAGQYKFSIGSDVGNNLYWDGVKLVVNGTIIDNSSYTTGGILYNDTTVIDSEVVTPSTQTLRTWTVTTPGSLTETLDVAFTYGAVAGTTVGIYKNGVLQGASYSLTQVSPTFYNLTRTFTAAVGDVISVVAYVPSPGAFIRTKNYKFTISSTQLVAVDNSASNGHSTTTYVMRRKIKMPKGGTVTAHWNLWGSNGAGVTWGRIYVNGAAYGTEHSVTGTTPVVFDDTVTFAAGDTVELWTKSGTTTPITFTGIFEMYANQAPIYPLTYIVP